MHLPEVQANFLVNNKYYVQVNNFDSDSLLRHPMQILDEQIRQFDAVIASRYLVSKKLAANIDDLLCEIGSWRMHLTKTDQIAAKYLLKTLTQLKKEEIDLEKMKAVEPVQIWKDIAPFVMKRLELSKQLAEEKSRLELIADSSDARPPAKRGTA